jgi:hypothetical protein
LRGRGAARNSSDQIINNEAQDSVKDQAHGIFPR